MGGSGTGGDKKPLSDQDLSQRIAALQRPCRHRASRSAQRRPRASDIARAQAQSKNLFTAIDESGALMWEAQDASGNVLEANVVDGVLAIVVGSPHYALGIDAKTGRVLCRYDGDGRSGEAIATPVRYAS